MVDMRDRRLTQWLEAARHGKPGALDEAFAFVYGELRRMAAGQIEREKPGRTLVPTALVHEAYLRLLPEPGEASNFENRRMFFAAASQAMRRILVERARRRLASKRGGGQRAVTLIDIGIDGHDADVDLFALDEALDALEKRSPQLAELVQLRFFGGLGTAQIAAQLDVSESSIVRQWRFARLWLYRRIEGHDRPHD